MTTKRPFIAAGFIWILSIYVFSGCYTVLKQSGEYYSEFGSDSSEKTAATTDQFIPADTLAEETDSTSAPEEGSETVVINRYYYDYSPWWSGFGYGYPGRYWAVSVGYSWYPVYGFYPYDYYYWGGCYYPAYPGGYYPYYPDPWYYHPGPSYPNYSSRRNYGLRHDVLNTSRAGGIHSAAGITPVLSQRTYNSGITASTLTAGNSQSKAAKETKKSRRRYNTKTGQTDSKTVEKGGNVKNKETEKRQYREVDIPKNNNRSDQRGFEGAKNRLSRNENSGNDRSSSRSYNNNSGGNSSRSSGSRASSPNAGGRSYNSKR